MSFEILIEQPAFAISRDLEQQWLFVEWRGAYNAKEAKEGCLQIMHAVQQTGCTKILNDSTDVLDGWEDTAEWIGENFFQQLADQNVHAIAWVLARNWSARIIIERVVLLSSRPAVVTFNELASAYEWLQNVD